MKDNNDNIQEFKVENDIDFITNDEINENIKKPKNIVKFIIIAAIIVVVLLLCVLGGKFLINKWNNGDISTPAIIENTGILGDDFRFFDGVYVNGVALDGLTVNEADTLLNSNPLETTPINLTIIANKKKFNFTEKDFQYEYNTSSVLKDAEEYCKNVRNGTIEKSQTKEFFIGATVTEKSIDKIINSVAKKVNSKPVNSTFNVNKKKKSFSYTKAKDGHELLKDDLKEKILTFLNNDGADNTIKAKVKIIKPKITSNDLKDNVVLLSEFSTYSTNTANGNKNMSVAFSKCTGSIIEPGEIWSFNACTGNSSLTSNGFVPATIISGGKYTTGIGGGLCQSSTTIYNAALYANLGIVQRRSHYWASTYCKEGFDASINYNNVDLKLKNTSKYPVYLECYMVGKKLTAKFYGRKSSSYDEIKLSSKRTSYVAGSHYDVAATRSWYKNGKLIKSESLTNSRYSLKPKNTVSSSSSKKKKPSSSKPTSSKKPTVSSKPSSKPQSSSQVSPSSTPTESSSTVSNTTSE